MANKPRLRAQQLALGLATALLFIAAGPLRVWWAHGDHLGSRSIQLANSTAGAVTNYTVAYAGQSAGNVGSVRLKFCADSALIDQPCTPPTGFDASSATLTGQSGMTGFSIAPGSTPNVVVLTRPPGPATPGTATFTLRNVTNPSATGSFFARLETFTSTDATGGYKDYGGLALATASQVNISTYVPPYLLFCTGITIQPYDCDTATGDYIDFGEFSTVKTSTGQTQLLAATNDEGGYTVHVDGTTPTSGNNTIPALQTPNVSRTGVSQFGLNLRANNTPHTGQDVQGPGGGTAQPGYSTPDFYKFNPGDTVISANGTNDYRLYTANYIVNVSRSQPSGVYVNTITFIGLANF